MSSKLEMSLPDVPFWVLKSRHEYIKQRLTEH